jgi:hypothetical protein
MNRILFVFVLVVFVLGSCNKEQPPLSKQEIKRKTDSLVQARKQESDERAKIDLDHRIKIEVRVKVDSILTARMKRSKGDTLKLFPDPPATRVIPGVRREPSAPVKTIPADLRKK